MSLIYADNILPSTTGYDIGSGTQRWDIFAQNLDVAGTVTFHNLLSPNSTIASLSATGGAGTLASPWTGWEASINALPINSHIHFPAGYYTQTTRIDMKVGWVITGDGQVNSIITSSFAGTAFRTLSAINSSTAINTSISGIAITNTHVAPTGACIENVGGSFFYVHDVSLTGGKYNIILDQATLVHIWDCVLTAPIGTNSGNIWLTNGADWSVGAAAGFTNRISIGPNVQFNNTAGVGIQVIDDGGVAHAIYNCNFNAGLVACRFANVSGLFLFNNESEGHTAPPFQWLGTTLVLGTAVGHSRGVMVLANSISDAVGFGSKLSLDFIDGGSIIGNDFAQTTVGNGDILFANGAANQVTGLTIGGNSHLITGAFRSAADFIDGNTNAVTRNNIFQEHQTYVTTSHAGGAQTVTPATMGGFTPIFVGMTLTCRNADGTNSEDVTVTAVGATTFDATFATSKSANWLVYGINGSTYRGRVFNATTGIIMGGTAPTAAAGQVALGGTTAATATNGTGEAMKANVEGYLIINVAGTAYKLPYVKN